MAKVASLQQAAAVGRIPVDEMVNELRAIVGQAPMSSEASDDVVSPFGTQPEWFDQDKVVASMVEEELDQDVMPINPLMRRAGQLREGEIIELVSTYLPAPGIDIMKTKGFLVWSVEDGKLIRTYFSKPAGWQ